MIRKKWLDTVWMNLLLLIFVNLIISGFLSYLTQNYILISVLSLAITAVLIGILHVFIFGRKISDKIKTEIAILYILILLTLELWLFWQPGLFALNMVGMRIVLVIVYFSEIYFISDGSSRLTLHLLSGKHKKIKTRVKKVKKK